jgi:L-fuconolactonase
LATRAFTLDGKHPRTGKRGNVACKISGMVTEADYQKWTPEQLQPYFDVVVEAFEPERLLFGSDWPVCLVATTYKAWANLVLKNISAFSANEIEKIMGGNAIRIMVYEIKSNCL